MEHLADTAALNEILSTSSLQPLMEEDVKLMLSDVFPGEPNRDDNRQTMDDIWSKITYTARMIALIENAEDVVVVSSTPSGSHAINMFARYTGVRIIAGKYTPGTFTCSALKRHIPPRLVIITDVASDSQALKEASFAKLKYVILNEKDPSNVPETKVSSSKWRFPEGLVYWTLVREVLRLRNFISPATDWKIPVDLFTNDDHHSGKQKNNKKDVIRNRMMKKRLTQKSLSTILLKTFTPPSAGLYARVQLSKFVPEGKEFAKRKDQDKITEAALQTLLRRKRLPRKVMRAISLNKSKQPQE